MFRKGKSAVEGNPKKVGVELKTRGELNKRRWGWRLAWWGVTDKREALHLLELRERQQRSGRIRALCVASTAAGT